MKKEELSEFLRQDLLPRNVHLAIRCNQKLATFLKGNAALAGTDTSSLVRCVLTKWAEKEGYNPCGL